jgi:heterotetrameric sarcosine oxidase delta subunit
MNAGSVHLRTRTDGALTMLRINCPWCGLRDEVEFRYRGDAEAQRPPAAATSAAGTEAFIAYVYERSNPRDWHLEWWLHVGGCRRLLKIERHTLTHEIRTVVDGAEHG